MTVTSFWPAAVLLAMVLAGGCRDQAGDEQQMQAANLLAAAQGDEGSLRQAEKLLNDLLRQDPERHATLVLRANLHTQRRQYELALADISATAKLLPDEPQYRLLACLLAERRGQAGRTCYDQVVALWGRDGSSPCEMDLNCVIADLMAESPHARQRRDQFLALPATETEAQLRHFILDDFDRQRYLKSILP